MTDNPVLTDLDERGRLTLTLDSPSNRNALSPELIGGLRDGLARADRDPDVRVVVLTHTGTTFCAGADLKRKGAKAPAGGGEASTSEGTSGTGTSGTPSGGGSNTTSGGAAKAGSGGDAMVGLLRAILTCRVPVICAVDGHVRAGGMGLVAACDFVVASTSASFGLSEVRIGVVAAIVSSVVCERIGTRTAADWMLTGRTVSAEDAGAAGFVTVVSDPTATVVDDLCDQLSRGGPDALAGTKTITSAPLLRRLDAEAEAMSALSARHFASAEAAAGIRAFAAKEPPPWHPQ